MHFAGFLFHCFLNYFENVTEPEEPEFCLYGKNILSISRKEPLSNSLFRRKVLCHFSLGVAQWYRNVRIFAGRCLLTVTLVLIPIGSLAPLPVVHHLHRLHRHLHSQSTPTCRRARNRGGWRGSVVALHPGDCNHHPHFCEVACPLLCPCTFLLPEKASCGDARTIRPAAQFR